MGAADAERTLAFTEKLSVFLTIVLIATYGLGLLFTLRTHREFFGAAESHREGDAAPWPISLALGILGDVTVLVALVSEVFVASVQDATHALGMSQAFVGFIVVALVGCGAEMASAFSGARKNRLDLSVGIALGSATQIALFVALVLVLASYSLGPQPMTLQFWPGAVLMVLLATVTAPNIQRRSLSLVYWRPGPCGLPDLRHHALPASSPRALRRATTASRLNESLRHRGRMRKGGSMSNMDKEKRQRVLDPVSRISEIIFGVLMALSFTGSLNAATSGREEVRTVMLTALGCNLAWGLVDAVMYLVATLTGRARNQMLLRMVRSASDPQSAHAGIAEALPGRMGEEMGAEGLEDIRQHLLALPDTPARVRFGQDDFLGALGVFLLVVLSTFPVVVPFMFISKMALAMRASNAVALVLLFIGGYRIGHYAGGVAWRAGLAMAAVGGVLVSIIMALGG